MTITKRSGFVFVMALAFAGCAERALDLPEPAGAAPDFGGDLSANPFDMRAPDLRTHIFDMRSADMNSADMNSADMNSADMNSNTADLNIPDLRSPPDLRVNTDLACRPGSCGAAQVALCTLGERCCSNIDCATNACDAFSQLCISDPCQDHIRDGAETDVDCGGGICPRCAARAACRVDDDCALFGGCDSLAHTCVDSDCDDHHMDVVETDVDCGGGGCNLCALGQRCLSHFDCSSNNCLNHVCVQFPCADGVKNFGESDIDCGAVCQRCALGKSCNGAYDCASNACDPGTHTCVASHCGDLISDGDETDIDCGGNLCAACAVGKRCLVSRDCAAGACDGQSRTCVADHCHDHRLDGDESDIDCGGPSCATCALYHSCQDDGDCASQHCDPLSHLCVRASCVDGVLDGNESAVDCGGECAPCGLEIACRIDEDCASQACDGIGLTCVSDQCADHRQEVYESDVDCGSVMAYMSVCPPCTLGKHCAGDWSCASEACDASNQCQVPRCVDGVKDGDESDVDCGGGSFRGSSACPRCVLGQKCATQYDCASLACDGLSATCVSDHCTDHAIDGDETDVDCGGPTCTARCAESKFCHSDSDCVSGLHCSGSPPACY